MMETLACSQDVLDERSKKKSLNSSRLQAATAMGLVTAGLTIGLISLVADSASACGFRSACVPVVRVCRSACVPTYARPTYYPRSRHAYPTFYGS